jgi:hypothetical protein
VQLGVAPNRIDLSTSIDGVTFEEVWRSAEVGQVGAQAALFIGLDELITTNAPRPAPRTSRVSPGWRRWRSAEIGG